MSRATYLDGTCKKCAGAGPVLLFKSYDALVATRTVCDARMVRYVQCAYGALHIANSEQYAVIKCVQENTPDELTFSTVLDMVLPWVVGVSLLSRRHVMTVDEIKGFCNYYVGAEYLCGGVTQSEVCPVSEYLSMLKNM